MEQVSKGPDHQAVLTETEIEGAFTMSVPIAAYEYGSINEFYNPAWNTIYTEPIEHGYVLVNRASDREVWNVHKKSVDRYLLLRGELDIALYDNRPDSSTHGTLCRVKLVNVGTPGQHAVKIPPGVWHTFRSLAGDFMLLNFKYPKYNREDPDKYTTPFDNDIMPFSWDD